MEILEMILLIMAYTVIIISLFLEVICYKRNIETLASIAFTSSLLLLIVALTTNLFFEDSTSPNYINLGLQLTMLLVGITTPLSTFPERKYSIPSIFLKPFLVSSVALVLGVIGCYFLVALQYSQYVVTTFLGLSVISTMLFIKFTKPKINIAHREKMQGYIATAFLVVTPLSLIPNFFIEEYEVNTRRIGFTLPLVFIFLGVSKIWDDVKRLSLFKQQPQVTAQDFQYYALTKREQEVAELLIKGTTYKQIASQLFISIPTVKTHTSNVYKKCKVSSRVELIQLLTK